MKNESPGIHFRQIAIDLILALEKWARDEDGIHPDAWEAYKTGRIALGASVHWDEENQEQKFCTSLHEDVRQKEGAFVW